MIGWDDLRRCWERDKPCIRQPMACPETRSTLRVGRISDGSTGELYALYDIENVRCNAVYN